ncbi:phage tail assembly chaperone [Vibrio cyclitrophicus]|uniref:phage tail assembly chaperone n=1 Tax=Vibrio cyclitrophicus TaxID=47951 RepID=UPI000C83D58B|nr:phage tail assembly chaperone [Vibrio cyclitrophicus]PMI48215.1 hypothetical protein BCU44_21490 [Vibrio cyclitrophicus]
MINYEDLHPECKLELLREARKPLLIEADYLVEKAVDKGLDAAPFRQYRDSLRDITQTYQTLKDVVWPQKPSLPQASA